MDSHWNNSSTQSNLPKDLPIAITSVEEFLQSPARLHYAKLGYTYGYIKFVDSKGKGVYHLFPINDNPLSDDLQTAKQIPRVFSQEDYSQREPFRLRFYCFFCSSFTASGATPELHILHCHVKQNLFKCCLCDEASKYKDDIQAHLREIHGLVDGEPMRLLSDEEYKGIEKVWKYDCFHNYKLREKQLVIEENGSVIVKKVEECTSCKAEIGWTSNEQLEHRLHVLNHHMDELDTRIEWKVQDQLYLCFDNPKEFSPSPIKHCSATSSGNYCFQCKRKNKDSKLFHVENHFEQEFFACSTCRFSSSLLTTVMAHIKKCPGSSLNMRQQFLRDFVNIWENCFRESPRLQNYDFVNW